LRRLASICRKEIIARLILARLADIVNAPATPHRNAIVGAGSFRACHRK
jgi:hypothetical protein